jgi:Icc-related predicted phosphoesterase
MDRPVRVAAMGDLHVVDQHPHPYRDLFGEIAEQADVMVLCGDLTNYGKLSEAEILAADIETSTIPVVAVLGNHDYEAGQPEEVRRILHSVGVHVLDGEAVEIHGVGFAGVKGFVGGYGRFMLSAFGEPAMSAFVQESVDEALKLESAIRTLRVERAMAVMHYSPIPETLVGEPVEIFPFLGCSRLAEPIDRFDEIRCAVHGHAHRGTYFGRTATGVPVYNCAQMVAREACGRPYALIEL